MASASRESSPIRSSERYRNAHGNGYVNGHIYENGNGNHMQNGHQSATDHSDDEYIDTVEVISIINNNYFAYAIVNVNLQFFVFNLS